MTKLSGIIILIFFSFSIIAAQSYLGKQHSLSLDRSAIMDLYSGDPNLREMADFFFAMDYKDIVNKVKAKGVQAEEDEATMSIEGKKVRMDMLNEGQKESYIINYNTNKIYSIMWAKKQYFEMDLENMKQMKQKVESQMSVQMEQMKGMMDQMPPEAKAYMDKMYGKKNQAPPKITSTGKTKTINGFNCTEYLVESENKIEQVWVTTKYPALRKSFQDMVTAMAGFKDEDDAIWDQVKDGWPARDSELEVDMMTGQGNFTINEIFSIEEKNHPKGTFDPPADFEKKTMQEVMMEGMGNE